MFARHVTLVASQVTTITMDKDYDRVEIVNKDDATEVHATIDGATPAIDGNNQLYLLGRSGVDEEPPTSGATVVKLISSGAPRVYVRGH